MVDLSLFTTPENININIYIILYLFILLLILDSMQGIRIGCNKDAYF